jgi:hypothetical protein
MLDESSGLIDNPRAGKALCRTAGAVGMARRRVE